MTDSLPFNFLGLDGEYSDYKRSRYTVLPVGYDATVSYRTGSREGAMAIVAASRQVELFDPELGREIFLPGVATLDPLECDARSAELMNKRILAACRKHVKAGKFLITLGGEHSISSAPIAAYAEKVKTLSVLHIDAHLDMRDSWQGSKYSHACVMRRVHELGVKTVSVGIRNVSQEEHTYLKKHPYPVFSPSRAMIEPVKVIEQVIDELSDNVYLSIDIDGFDPAVAPGTGTPEPGGLTWFFVNDLLRQIASTRRLVGADIVEVLPIPGQVVTEFMAARLAGRIIALSQLADGRKRR